MCGLEAWLNTRTLVFEYNVGLAGVRFNLICHFPTNYPLRYQEMRGVSPKFILSDWSEPRLFFPHL